MVYVGQDGQSYSFVNMTHHLSTDQFISYLTGLTSSSNYYNTTRLNHCKAEALKARNSSAGKMVKMVELLMIKQLHLEGTFTDENTGNPNSQINPAKVSKL